MDVSSFAADAASATPWALINMAFIVALGIVALFKAFFKRKKLLAIKAKLESTEYAECCISNNVIAVEPNESLSRVEFDISEVNKAITWGVALVFFAIAGIVFSLWSWQF